MGGVKELTSRFRNLASELGPGLEGKSQIVAGTPATREGSAFQSAASEMALGVHRTEQQLNKLMELVKVSNLVNDASPEINQLTALIKQNITSLQRQITSLRELTSDSAANQLGKHNRKVVDILRSRLADAASRFQSVLELRTDILKKQQETKRSILGVSTVTQRKRRVQHPSIATSSGPSVASSSYHDAASFHSTNDQLFDFDEEGREAGGAVSIQMPPMFVQAELEEYNYASDRADAVETIERTLQELGGMFSEIASQLTIHSEFIQRIDMNIDNAAANISSAHEQLLVFWHNMQGSRWLYFKIFGVVFFFIVVFMMLFA